MALTDRFQFVCEPFPLDQGDRLHLGGYVERPYKKAAAGQGRIYNHVSI